MSQPRVTVVVPSYNRPDQLRACVEALQRQTLPPADFEVVVVDDGSPTPGADALAGLDPAGPAVRVIRQPNAGPSVARNRGVCEAIGALIAFTDDDCRPDPDWLEALMRSADARPDCLVGGTTYNGLPELLFSEASQFVVDLVYEHFNHHRDHAYFLTSNNLICSRARFLEMGGFDTGFDRAGAEDRDFCDRWRLAGRGIVWEPSARIEHRHPQNLRKYVDLHYRYGRGARRYHANRLRRDSGTVHEDVAFHRSLPWRVWGQLGRYCSPWRRLQVVWALGLWQLANCAGFAASLISEPRLASNALAEPVPLTPGA